MRGLTEQSHMWSIRAQHLTIEIFRNFTGLSLTVDFEVILKGNDWGNIIRTPFSESSKNIWKTYYYRIMQLWSRLIDFNDEHYERVERPEERAKRETKRNAYSWRQRCWWSTKYLAWFRIEAYWNGPGAARRRPSTRSAASCIFDHFHWEKLQN